MNDLTNFDVNMTFWFACRVCLRFHARLKDSLHLQPLQAKSVPLPMEKQSCRKKTSRLPFLVADFGMILGVIDSA